MFYFSLFSCHFYIANLPEFLFFCLFAFFIFSLNSSVIFNLVLATFFLLFLLNFQHLSTIPGVVCHFLSCFHVFSSNHLLYSFFSFIPHLQLISVTADLPWPESLERLTDHFIRISAMDGDIFISLHSGLRDICTIVRTNIHFICMSGVIRNLFSSMEDAKSIVLIGLPFFFLFFFPTGLFLLYILQYINKYVLLPEFSSYS